MANKIVLKKSSEALKVPAAGDLDYGELALNFTDGKLYYKTASNNISSFSAASGAGTVDSVAGKTGVVTLTSSDVGLGSVDNTSDANKPVSTATQTALDTKQATLVSGTNIKTVNGTSVLGSGNIQIDGGVTSFNTRTGAVTLSSGDVTSALTYTPVNKAGDTITGDLLNSATYSAPSNGAGAGTKLVIKGSTGTGAAGSSGGHGHIEILGAGVTTLWTGFASATEAARRGGVLVQAGAAQGDAGNSYVNGSALELYAGNGTNNGTTVGNGGRVILQSGQTTKTDSQTSTGSTITLEAGRGTDAGSFLIQSGNFDFGNLEYARGSAITGSRAFASAASTVSISGGAFTTGFAQVLTENTGGRIDVSGGSATTGGSIVFTPGTVYSGIAGGTNGTVRVGSNVILHAGNYTSYAPSLTGSGASGTWSISISGNAATASNGGVTSAGGYTGAVTATNLLDAIKTVDGAGSGLDADLLDGNSSAAFYLASNPSSYTSNTGTVTSIDTNNGITGGTITTTGTLGLTGQALALHNLSTSGIVVRTGADTFAGRTLTASTGISISNGDGVSGNPTITNSAPDQTVVLTGAGATSITGTYPNFTISSTDTNTTYTDGDGIALTGTTFSVVAGSGLVQEASGLAHADTSSQASVDNSNGTVIQDITLDTFGHITAIGSLNLDDRYYTETESDSRFVNTSGDTMTGFLTLHADPTSALHAATKEYVDNVAAGLKAAPAVEAATTANLSANYSNGTLGVGATLTATTNGAFPDIDGITVSVTTVGLNGVLIKNQTDSAHNGRYNLTQVGNASTPWILTRCRVCDESSEIPGSYVFVKAGTAQAGTGWVAYVTNPSTFTVGTDNIIYFQFSGAGTYTAGSGLTLTGTQFSHTDTSSVANVDNSGNTFIQDLTFDTFGHVTGVVSAAVSIPGTNIAEGTRTTTTVPITSSTGTGATLSAATTSLAGVMTSDDKTKLDGIATGATANTGTVTGVTATAPVASSGGTAPVISMAAASSGVDGYMTGAYATKLDGIAAGATANTGTVTGVTGTAPVVSSGGTSPAISMAAASSGVNGYMTGAYATKLDGIAAGATANTGTVTSVDTTGTVSGLTLTGGPITTTGTITLGGTLAVLPGNFASQTANTVLAAPNGSAGTPTFRLLVAADIPALNQSTTGTASAVVNTVAGTGSIELVRGNMGDNDQARILVGAAATNEGFLEIATADDGTEPIYVRQYTGVFTSLQRTATLLDGSGNTSFPGSVTANGVTLTGNTGTVTGVTGTAPVVSSGGTAPAISMAAASSGVNGYMTGAYATKLDGIASGATNVTNNNQLTNGAGYITGYSETDTLASVTGRGNTASGNIGVPAGDGTGYCFWGNGSSYKISMGVGSLYQYGTVTDYSIKMQMDAGSVNRGFTWGRDGVAPIASLNSTSGNMQIAGTFSAASKSFLIPHPTKPGMQLRYGSLEGPENGVYIRGKLKGKNKIELPEYWTKLVDPDSITVTLTPIGKHQKLYVEDISNNVVTIANDGLFAGEINCFFVVYGERVDIDKLVVEYE